MENISTKLGTTLFEPNNGTLNIAPTKLSGQYKIVVDKDLNLWLDDYNSRRVMIDKTQQFLPQVANFLSTKNTLGDINNLRYGGFSRNTKSYHIPLHINKQPLQTTPKYFVLSRIENKHIESINDIYSVNNIIGLIDLTRIGITNIFNEILDFDCKPVYLDFDSALVKIEGYSIDKLSKGYHSITLDNTLANQNYFDVTNNTIMNAFVDAKLFVPNFINLEFEFEYFDLNKFNNFFGYLSYDTNYDNTSTDVERMFVNVFDGNNYAWEQISKDAVQTAQPTLYDELETTITIQNIYNQLPQVRLRISNVSVEDYIIIYHPDGTTFFEYYITTDDMKATFVETMRLISAKIQVLTNYNVLTAITFESNNVAILTLKLQNENINGFTIEVPRAFKLPDETIYFKQITDNEIKYLGNNIFSKIQIGTKDFEIVDTFKFNGDDIISLNEVPNIQTQEYGKFYVRKETVIKQLQPIPFYNVFSDLKSTKQYDRLGYIENLRKNFITNRPDTTHIRYNEFVEVSTDAINSFEQFISLEPLQYINDETIEKDYAEIIQTVSSNVVDNLEHQNNDTIKTMMFSDTGSTSYITPNTLNFDKQFFSNNGNLNHVLVDNDINRFNWFLIKGACPDYLTDINRLRYFETVPNFTSRIRSVGNYCEVTFLGVKYRFESRYNDYEFCTYLDFTNETEYEITYKFEISHTNKTIFLVIHKFLDFIDLIRGGNKDLSPLIDLSFFYNVQESHNSLSESLYSFKSGGVLLCDNETPVMFNNQLVYDWKHYFRDKWYVCLKRSNSVITDSFKDIFPSAGDFQFFVYSSASINGEIVNYVAIRITVKSIILVDDNYVWSEDIEIEFFDTNNLVLNQTLNDESTIFHVDPNDIVSIIPYFSTADEQYKDYESVITILHDAMLQQFTIISPNKPFSIKEYYFEFSKTVTHHPITQVPTESFDYFVFDDYFDGGSAGKSFEYFMQKFGIDSFDSVTNKQQLTLFDRHQLWKIIKEILKTDVRFKHSTRRQTKKLIDELLLTNLADYSEIQTIESNIEDEKVKLSIVENDTNLVVWKDYTKSEIQNRVFKIDRYKGYYYPTLFVTDMKKFQIGKQQSFMNIYDKNFAGENISATGYWSEVHNVISSLFCLQDEFSITNTFEQTFNYYDKISKMFEIPIMHHKNIATFEKMYGNVDLYLSQKFVEYIHQFYKISDVFNELGERLRFEIVKQEQTQYILNIERTTNSRFNNITIIFKPK